MNHVQNFITFLFSQFQLGQVYRIRKIFSSSHDSKLLLIWQFLCEIECDKVTFLVMNHLTFEGYNIIFASVFLSTSTTCIFTTPICTTTIITLEPCALNAEFQHFILRFILMFLLSQYDWQRVWGGGVKERVTLQIR